MIDHLLKWERWNLYNHNNQYNFKLFFAEEIENIKRNQFYNVLNASYAKTPAM
jgi:hypothetical protein